MTDPSRALPEFVELDLGESDHYSLEDIKTLESLYREHCEVSPFALNPGRWVIWHSSV